MGSNLPVDMKSSSLTRRPMGNDCTVSIQRRGFTFRNSTTCACWVYQQELCQQICPLKTPVRLKTHRTIKIALHMLQHSVENWESGMHFSTQPYCLLLIEKLIMTFKYSPGWEMKQRQKERKGDRDRKRRVCVRLCEFVSLCVCVSAQCLCV